MIVADDTDRIVLDDPPSLTALYARAVQRRAATGDPTLPSTTVARTGVAIDRGEVADLARVCGLRLRDRLPPTYLHLLAFPLSIHLMVEDDFPFPLLGMVHLHQQVVVHDPVTADAVVDLAVRVDGLRAHPRGRQFDVHATATVGSSVVWTGRSTYLHRDGRRDDEVVDGERPADVVDVDGLPLTARWRVPADTGRQYASVSGDRNPIHLSALTARPLGFDRPIAHGMWTLTRALGALDGRLPDRSTTDASFLAPLPLPSTVELATEADADDWLLGVRARDGKPHLRAVVSPTG